MRQNVDVYFDFWKSMVRWVNMYLNKNHGVWILGHLIASEDDLSEYLGKGPMAFPNYQTLFKQSSK